MNHRNPRRDTFWPTHVRVNDEIVSIASLLESGAAVADIRGNAAEGWACYLYHPDHPATAQQISAVFSREQGDTRAQILAAAARTYGRVIKPSKYMHPAVECWPFPTYPKPKTTAEIEAEQQQAVAARVESARRRFGSDVKGCVGWLDTERKQALYIAANSMNLRERDKSTKEAALLVHAIEQIKANPGPEVMQEIAQAEAAQVETIEVEDGSADAAFIAEHFPAPKAWPIAVRIAFSLDSANPNTIFNRLKARHGRAPTNEEMRGEVCRIIREAEAGAETEKTERLPAAPIAKHLGEPVYTVMGMMWGGALHDKLIRVNWDTRAQAEAYRNMVQMDYTRPSGEQTDKIGGLILQRNDAARHIDRANGLINENPNNGWEVTP